MGDVANGALGMGPATRPVEKGGRCVWGGFLRDVAGGTR